ncbi:MAG: MBL fold metallo-hydrolase [PVC group bacterium]
MLQVVQFGYGGDNLGYLVHDTKEAIAIDPGNPGFAAGYLRKHGLRLKEIRNTHSHFDHTSGNRGLAAEFGVRAVPSSGGERFSLGDDVIEVIPTPGHTPDSVSFRHNGWVITGDTLFIANAGNCSSGLLRAFRESLARLLALPDETVIYPGHDYTDRSLRRAMLIEPENEDIRHFQSAYRPPPVVSTIGAERKINPYIRTDEPPVVAYLEKNGKPTGTALERFGSFLDIN